jgi:hypothetical protein
LTLIVFFGGLVSYTHLGHDDGERASETLGLIGCAFLTMLNELDRTGHLKPDSQFRDLSLVMCLAIKWGNSMQDWCMDESDHLGWRGTIVAYAKKGGIDLAAAPLSDAQELIDSVDYRAEDDLGKAKVDRWGWRKKVFHAPLLRFSSSWKKLTSHSSSGNSWRNTVNTQMCLGLGGRKLVAISTISRR